MNKPIPVSRMGSLFSPRKEENQPAIMTQESRVTKPEQDSHESLPTKHESGIMSHDSAATTRETQNIDNEVMRHESLPMNHESLLMNRESGIMSIDLHALNTAVAQGSKDPRISAYSPLVMSVLRYLRKTTPEFSMSEVASNLLEDAIREKYPELSTQVERALAKK
jgi:hypothetical protein